MGSPACVLWGRVVCCVCVCVRHSEFVAGSRVLVCTSRVRRRRGRYATVSSPVAGPANEEWKAKDLSTFSSSALRLNGKRDLRDECLETDRTSQALPPSHIASDHRSIVIESDAIPSDR